MENLNVLNLIGYDKLFKNLVNNFIKKTLPNKILISGNTSIGKCTFAIHFVNYILSEKENFSYNLDTFSINPNNNSYKKIKNQSHPNFHLISLKKDKKSIEIGQIKEMFKFINQSTFGNNLKIVMIDNVEFLNLSSSNALLKNLEEPNDNVLYLLIHNKNVFLSSTIKSRCINVKLNLSNSDVENVLKHITKKDILKSLSKDFVNLTHNISFYLNFYEFCVENEIDFSNISIENLLKLIFKNKLYVKSDFIHYNLKLFMEIYFKKNFINTYDNDIYSNYQYFNNKYKSFLRYNLDYESFLMEFNTKFLNA